MVMVRVLAGFFVLGIAFVVIGYPILAYEEGVFSAGGGPLFVGVLIDTESLQSSLAGFALQGDLRFGGTELFLLHGGGGFVGIDSLRVGYVSTSGRWSLAMTKPSLFDRADLALNYSGLMLEELITESSNSGFVLGVVGGGGAWDLRMSKSPPGNFEELILHPPVSLELRRSFWFALPYISAEFKVLDFAGIRIGAGFWEALSFDDWRLPDGQATIGGPLKNTGFPVFQIMLVFGW